MSAFQRAADGGIAVRITIMNGLRRANGNAFMQSMGDAVESALKKPAYDGMRNNSLVQAHRSMQERVKFTKPGGTAG